MAEKIKWNDVVAPSNATANELLANGLIKIGNSFDKLHEGAKTFQTAVRNNIQADIAHKLNQYNPEDFYNENRQKTLTDINNYLVDIDNQSGGEVTKEMWQMANDFKNDKIIENNQQMTHEQNAINHANYMASDTGDKLAIEATKNPDNATSALQQAINASNPNTYKAFVKTSLDQKEQANKVLDAQDERKQKEDDKTADNIVGLYSPSIITDASALAVLNNPDSSELAKSVALSTLNKTDEALNKTLENMPVSVKAKVLQKRQEKIAKQLNDVHKMSYDNARLKLDNFKATADIQNQAEKSAIEQRELQLKESGGYFNKDDNDNKSVQIDKPNRYGGILTKEAVSYGFMPKNLTIPVKNKDGTVTETLNSKAIQNVFINNLKSIETTGITNKDYKTWLDENKKDLTNLQNPAPYIADGFGADTKLIDVLNNSWGELQNYLRTKGRQLTNQDKIMIARDIAYNPSNPILNISGWIGGLGNKPYYKPDSLVTVLNSAKLSLAGSKRQKAKEAIDKGMTHLSNYFGNQYSRAELIKLAELHKIPIISPYLNADDLRVANELNTSKK